MHTLISTLLIAFAFTTNSHALEMDYYPGYIDPVDVDSYDVDSHGSSTPVDPVSDIPRFEKFSKGLDALKIPQEATPDYDQDFPKALDGRASWTGVKEIMRYIDPQKALQNYLHIEEPTEAGAPVTITAYKDTYSTKLPADYLEHTFHLNTTDVNSDSPRLINRLQKIANQVKTRNSDASPLAGLKILLDPGHIGNEEFDDIEGKHVLYPTDDRHRRIPGSHNISEGELNLWTAYLAANELTELGAAVYLSRPTDATIIHEDLEHWDPTPQINQFFYDGFDLWIMKYFSQAQATFNQSLENSESYKNILESKVQNTGERKREYVMSADLDARAALIDANQYDLVIPIHYDALQTYPDDLVKGDDVDAYVPGSYIQSTITVSHRTLPQRETGSRRIRELAIKHLLEVRRWHQAVDMAGAITSAVSKELSKELKVDLTTLPKIDSAIKVRDGVYVRNLHLLNRLRNGLMVYLEGFHYDNKDEWELLTNQKKHPYETGTYAYAQAAVAQSSYFNPAALTVKSDWSNWWTFRKSSPNQVTFSYPPRIKAVAEGIKTGIMNYFENFDPNVSLTNKGTRRLPGQAFEFEKN